ncbi:MAG: central glycolytic s regulator [Clostridia bacterium]|jgi:central glycolytic genes regulator|nr:central glycolytic s regulator [Clostridia bacterium]
MAEQAFFLGKLAPELIEVVQRRYNILRTIGYMQPIGRRILAEKLNLPERMVRNDVETLRQQELILAEPKGMSIAPLGEKLLEELSVLVHGLRGLDNLEKILGSKLSVHRVVIVPGDIDSEPIAKEELGRVSAFYVSEIIKNARTIAVAGGTTLAEMAKHIIPQNRKDLLILPARGGLGEQVEIQSNTITAKIAEKLGASYRLLHVPDYMSKTSAEQLVNDPYIAPIIQLIRETDVLIHGIGDALEMAKRRGVSWEEIELLKNKKAKGEAFGYYFDAQGSIIYSTPSIGLKLDDLGKINTVIAIAGGKNKAAAIEAVSKAGHIKWLIIDEGAAWQIAKDLNLTNKILG